MLTAIVLRLYFISALSTVVDDASALNLLDKCYANRLAINRHQITANISYSRHDITGVETKRKYTLSSFRNDNRILLHELEFNSLGMPLIDRYQCNGCTSDGLTHIFDKKAGWHGAANSTHKLAAVSNFDLRLLGMYAAVPESVKSDSSNFYRLPIYQKPYFVKRNATGVETIIEQLNKDGNTKIQYTIDELHGIRLLSLSLESAKGYRVDIKNSYLDNSIEIIPHDVRLSITKKNSTEHVNILIEKFDSTCNEDVFKPTAIGLKTDDIVSLLSTNSKSNSVVSYKIIRDGGVKAITQSDIERIQKPTINVVDKTMTSNRSQHVHYWFIAFLFSISVVSFILFYIIRKRQ